MMRLVLLAIATVLTSASLASAIPIGGCSAIVRCPGGGSVRCVSAWPNGCVEQPLGSDPWVACDGDVVWCPA